MKIKSGKLLAIMIGWLALCSPIFAHHGNAAYDESHPLTLKGKVTQYKWANPHTLIYFDASGEKGGVVHWVVETLSTTKLARAGWTQDALKAGDKVTIVFSPAKDGQPFGFLQRIMFADGRQLGMLEHPQ